LVCAFTVTVVSLYVAGTACDCKSMLTPSPEGEEGDGGGERADDDTGGG
jgi:hypothetical protein